MRSTPERRRWQFHRGNFIGLIWMKSLRKLRP
jgi:hypothetical protein